METLAEASLRGSDWLRSRHSDHMVYDNDITNANGVRGLTTIDSCRMAIRAGGRACRCGWPSGR